MDGTPPQTETQVPHRRPHLAQRRGSDRVAAPRDDQDGLLRAPEGLVGDFKGLVGMVSRVSIFLFVS